jgi:acyl-CoA synthetase (NDP forming)
MDEGGMAESRAKVDALLNPKNIVILGATDKPGNWPQRVWRNLKRYNFPGAVYPFNPGRESVWDTRCYRNFSELPEAPDHLVVLIPAHAVPDALLDAAKAGARSATVMTSGFDEAENAAELSARLKRVIAETGLAVSGPNCLGNLHAPASLMTMPDDRPQKLSAGPVAIIGQSGGIAMAIKRTLEERGIDSGSAITSGNETGLTTADYIAYFAESPGVSVIVSYLESVHDTDGFLSACRLARTNGKPVIVVKLGASDEGRAAALAHTGRLAGSMEAFDAVAGSAGVMRVANFDAVVEAVEYCVHAPLPKGRGLGAVTFSGGLRGMLLDAAAAHGLAFTPLSDATRQKLNTLVSVGTIIGNPMDSGFAALTSQDAYLRCIETLLADPEIDLLLLQEELPRGPGTERKESNLRAVNAIAARANKAIAFVTMISHGLTEYSRTLRAELPNVAFLQEIDKSLATARAVIDYATRPATAAAPAISKLKTKTANALAKLPAGALSEVASKALLKPYGITTPKEAVAGSEKEAVAFAKSIGFPVVAKAVSASLAHKSEAGAVKVALTKPADVSDAYIELTTKVARRARITLDGVLIAQQVSDGLELVLGVHRDPEMGLVILFGAGGVDLELHRDVALAALPLDEAGAQALIARTRVAQLIAGYRGKAAYDEKAVVKALIGLSQFAMDAGARLQSVDINPFLLKRRGGVALDALVVLN